MPSFEVEHDMCGWMVSPRHEEKGNRRILGFLDLTAGGGMATMDPFSWESWWVPYPLPWDSHDELWIKMGVLSQIHGHAGSFLHATRWVPPVSWEFPWLRCLNGLFSGNCVSRISRCQQWTGAAGNNTEKKRLVILGQIDIYQQKLFKSDRITKTLTHLMFKIWGGLFTTHITIPNRWIPYEFMFEKKRIWKKCRKSQFGDDFFRKKT